jgi:hypothetical protein
LPPPQPAGLAAAVAPLPQQFEAKVEKIFFTRPLPHLVQVPASSSPLFPALYRSNESPQESHRYSYMGIIALLFNQLRFFSLNL